jgi:phage gpG-like protein
VIKVAASVSIRLPTGKFPTGSFAAALRPLVEPMRAEAEAAFESERDPVTMKPWDPPKAPLKPDGRKLLNKSGLLKRETLAAISAARITGNTLSVKIVNPEYERFHRLGTRKMKARRTVGASIATVGRLARALRGEAVKIFTRPRGS